MIPDKFYRVSIKALCVRDGKVLLLKEFDTLSGKWDLPGGGLDYGESIEDCLKREVKEELGLSVGKMGDKPIYAWTVFHEKERSFHAFVLAYQVWVDDSSFTPSDEACAFDYFDKEELSTLSIHIQSEYFKNVFDLNDFVT
jgi:8-oxo-dGTP diphosphatase